MTAISRDGYIRKSIDSKAQDRIVLIGPVLPYRGGIAQHTTMLHRALRVEVDCLTISFTRQYPHWLFPGKNDKDDNLVCHIEDGVEYLIDSLNPMTWFKAIKRVREFEPRMVVFPWWHVYWAACFTLISKQLRKTGVEIVFLCHNVIDHEDTYWKRVIANFVFLNANRFVVHSRRDRCILNQRFPGCFVDIHPHPMFEHFPKPRIELARRAKIELLFFGFVRPYKGLDVLLEAMTLLKKENVFLSIVGEFWKGKTETLNYIATHGIAEKVEVVPYYVSDVDAASYFSRSDVVVLPYRSSTGTGIIPLAYHYRKPVIATRVGSLAEIVEDGYTGILIDSGKSGQLVDAVKKILSGDIGFSEEAIESFKKRLAWDSLANTIVGKRYKNVDQNCS